MQGSLFLLNKVRERFLGQEVTEFEQPISQSILDIEDKTRSNIFTWRGQFSPQLIENLLLAYCPRDAVVLDPFVGSGTVLHESACLGLQAFGCEVNPAAWILSRIYEFANLESCKRAKIIGVVEEKLNNCFTKGKFNQDYHTSIELSTFESCILNIYSSADNNEKAIIDALVILLDLANNALTVDRIQKTFYHLSQTVRNLPHSCAPVVTSLCDARALPFVSETIDFVLTSPPYINVFNYHQNYRRSAESLGWDLLEIAKSEIGSNRANRGNRFFTAIQYCLDMALVLREIHRVCKPNSRLLFIVGYESSVLGVPFYNSNIISAIANKTGSFNLVMNQKRTFKNRFGKSIREDILHLVRRDNAISIYEWCEIARRVARETLTNALNLVEDDNKKILIQAIEKIPNLSNSPLLPNNPIKYSRNIILSTNFYRPVSISTKSAKTMIQLPTPHYDKLLACLNNSRLPAVDRDRVEEAQKRYQHWIQALESVPNGQHDSVEKLVEVTNQYKRFIELELIFDSPDNFLYRQKGQLKLDNTILEEFLPQLIYRSLRGIDDSFEIGPKNTFAGLSFLSSLGNPGRGGEPTLRTKNQDFVLGKKLYLKTAFNNEFTGARVIESYLGYICAECKTNLDKTMFQEAVATSRDLKIAVPSSLYFLVCEFLDMTPVSITSTQIDDVLIVRKSRRMSANIRQEYKTPESRKKHRQEYADFIDASKYYPDVFQRMIDKIQTLVKDTAPKVEQVLEQGHF